jgi:DNA-binding transcriptional LysR family regulator
LKIDHLIYFLETARHEHIGKASKAVAISPSAISHAITNLEAEFGVKLFVNKGKNIFLSEQGKEFKLQAEKLVREYESLKTVSKKPLSMRGHIRIAASHMIGGILLPGPLAELLKKNPQLSAEVLSYRSSEVVKGVTSGAVDLGICFSPQDRAGLSETVLLSGSLHIIVRDHHPVLKEKKSDQIRALQDYPSTLPKAFEGIDVCVKHPIFQKFGLKPNPVFLFDSYDVALEQVKHSDSWSFVPDLLAQKRKGICLVSASQTQWDAPYRISALVSSDRPVSPAVQLLVDQIKIS